MNKIIQFGTVSVGTAKKILREIRSEYPGMKRIRPIGPPIGARYITPQTSKKMIEAFKRQNIFNSKMEIQPHTVIVPRVGKMMKEMKSGIEEMREGIRRITPKKSLAAREAAWARTDRINDPIGMGLHEHGHVSMPKSTDSALSKVQKHAMKTGGIKATHPYFATAIQEEYRANRDILSRIRKHGTSKEAEEWIRRSQDQIKQGYRIPYFNAALMAEATKKEWEKAISSGKTPLSLKRRVIQKYPHIRKQQLSSRSSIIEFRLMPDMNIAYYDAEKAQAIRKARAHREKSEEFIRAAGLATGAGVFIEASENARDILTSIASGTGSVMRNRFRSVAPIKKLGEIIVRNPGSSARKAVWAVPVVLGGAALGHRIAAWVNDGRANKAQKMENKARRDMIIRSRQKQQQAIQKKKKIVQFANILEALRLSSPSSIIEFAPGDYAKKILKNTEWQTNYGPYDPDPHKDIFESVTANKTGSEEAELRKIKKGTHPLIAKARKRNELLGHKLIPVEEIAKIEKKAQAARRRKAREMLAGELRAGLKTGAPGEVEIKEKIQRIYAASEKAAAEAEMVGNVKEAKRHRMEAAKKAREIEIGYARQIGKWRDAGGQKINSKFPEQQLIERRKKYRKAIADEVRDRRAILQNLRDISEGKKRPKIDIEKIRSREIKRLTYDAKGAASRKAADKLLIKEMLPLVKSDIDKLAKEKIKKRAEWYKKALRKRAERIVKEEHAKSIKGVLNPVPLTESRIASEAQRKISAFYGVPTADESDLRSLFPRKDRMPKDIRSARRQTPIKPRTERHRRKLERKAKIAERGGAAYHQTTYSKWAKGEMPVVDIDPRDRLWQERRVAQAKRTYAKLIEPTIDHQLKDSARSQAYDAYLKETQRRMYRSKRVVKQVIGNINRDIDASGNLRKLPGRIVKEVGSVFVGGRRNLGSGIRKIGRRVIFPALVAGGLAAIAAKGADKRKKEQDKQKLMSSKGRVIEFTGAKARGLKGISKAGEKIAKRVTKKSSRRATKQAAQHRLTKVTGEAGAFERAAYDAWLQKQGMKLVDRGRSYIVPRKAISPLVDKYIRRGKELRVARGAVKKLAEAAEKTDRRAKAYKRLDRMRAKKYQREAEEIRKTADRKLADAIEAHRYEMDKIKEAYRSNLDMERKNARMGARIIGIGAGALGLLAGATGATIHHNKNRKEQEYGFSRKEKEGINPYLMAGMSGATSGAVLGALPILRKGVTTANVLKSMGVSALLSGSIVGGGAKIGSNIMGEPREEERSAFTRRAAIGGGIVGGTIGALGGIALKSKMLGRLRPIRKVQSWVKKAAETWKPAQTIQSNGPVVAGGLGALVGGGYGMLQGADEGQQVDSILNIRKDMKKMSSKSRVIELASDKRSAVAKHRYLNRIEDQEWRRKESNIMRSALAGGGLAAVLRKRIPLKHTGSAILSGMGAGAGVQVAVQKLNPKDEYGDKTVKAKRIEALPSKLIFGTGLGIIGYKGIKKATNLIGKLKHNRFASKAVEIQMDAYERARDIAAAYGRSKIEKYYENRRIEKDWRRAQREANKARRNLNRVKNLIADAPLKIRGEKKLDSRGRERKNEWDKSWVKNAAIATGMTLGVLATKGKLDGIKKAAKTQRDKGLPFTGPEGLYNIVRGIFKRQIKRETDTIIGTPLYKKIRQHRYISRPLIRMKKAWQLAKNDWKEIERRTANKIIDKLENTYGVSKNKNIPREKIGEMKEASAETLNKLRKKEFSSRKGLIQLADTVEAIPVIDHERRRRRTKEELHKETLQEERSRHTREKWIAALLGVGTGGGSLSLYNRYSPKAREMRRIGEMNEQQIKEEVERRTGEAIKRQRAEEIRAENSRILKEKDARRNAISKYGRKLIKKMAGKIK